MKHFFGGVKKQNRTHTTTTAGGTKVKKMIETQIPFAASAKFKAKENKKSKTHKFLNCGVFFAAQKGKKYHA